MRTRAALIAAATVLGGFLGGCAKPVDFGPAVAPSPGAVTGMHHILLTVSDLGRSVGFYRDVLGMKVEYRSFHFAMLEAGNYGVALSDKPWEFEKKGEAKGVGMIPHFTTPDMDAFAARLKEHGVPWLREPHEESFGIEAFITGSRRLSVGDSCSAEIQVTSCRLPRLAVAIGAKPLFVENPEDLSRGAIAPGPTSVTIRIIRFSGDAMGTDGVAVTFRRCPWLSTSSIARRCQRCFV